jgi:hypothetical protein
MSLTPPNLCNQDVTNALPQMLGQGHEEGVRRYSAFPEDDVLNVNAINVNGEMLVRVESAGID